jgi:hypothetical protein
MKKIDAFIAGLAKKQENTCCDVAVAVAVGALVVAGIAFAVEYIL